MHKAYAKNYITVSGIELLMHLDDVKWCKMSCVGWKLHWSFANLLNELINNNH